MSRPDTSPICVSIGEADPAVACERAQRALSLGASLVELRTDYWPTLDVEALQKAAGEFMTRCVLTCRPRWDGGRYAKSEADRATSLGQLAGLRPAYLDVELQALEASPDLRSSFPPELRLMVSWHDHNATPTTERLRDIYGRATKFSPSLVKLVPYARMMDDNASVLQLYQLCPRGTLLAFCMGREGAVSRLLAPVLGAPFTYAALTNVATADGQLPLLTTRAILNALRAPS
jgi:3-dehydroquinate dehydratase type I